MDFIGHYRKTKYNDWHLYVGGEVVVEHIKDPATHATTRFPGHKVVHTGNVMVDVRVKETLS